MLKMRDATPKALPRVIKVVCAWSLDVSNDGDGRIITDNPACRRENRWMAVQTVLVRID